MAKRRNVGGSEVRAFAIANGIEVGARGRFSQDLIKAFEKSNKGLRYEPNHVPTRKISGTRVTDSGRRVPVTVTATLSEVRAFASEAGLPIGARGRVSAEVLSAFAARPKI